MMKKIEAGIWLLILIALLAGCTNQTLKDNREFGITVSELQYKLDSSTPPLLIDVRTSDEFYSGHLPGAKLFPANDIFMNTAQIPADREVVLYCSDGQRSLLVAKHLRAHGYTRVMRLNGGIKGWPGDIKR